MPNNLLGGLTGSIQVVDPHTGQMVTLNSKSIESCDDGSQCSDGTQCDINDLNSCFGIGDQICKPRNGDGCSEYCRVEFPHAPPTLYCPEILPPSIDGISFVCDDP